MHDTHSNECTMGYINIKVEKIYRQFVYLNCICSNSYYLELNFLLANLESSTKTLWTKTWIRPWFIHGYQINNHISKPWWTSCLSILWTNNEICDHVFIWSKSQKQFMSHEQKTFLILSLRYCRLDILSQCWFVFESGPQRLTSMYHILPRQEGNNGNPNNYLNIAQWPQSHNRIDRWFEPNSPMMVTRPSSLLQDLQGKWTHVKC